MSNPKSKTPLIVGVVVALVVAGGALLFASKNMTKEEAPAVEQSASSGETASSADAPTKAADAEEAPTADEEKAVTENAGAEIEGVAVKPGNPVVAKVDGRDISRVDVFRYIRMLPQNMQQLPPSAVYPLALEQVINTRLVQNKAESAGLENDPEVQRQMALAKQQIVRSLYVQRDLDSKISTSDLKKAYKDYLAKMPQGDEIKASHILVDSEEKAKEIITKLNEGEDFATLAAANSQDPGNKDKGGDLGWFTKQDMVPEFGDAAFKIAKGKISETPIKTQFGYHVVKVFDKRKTPKPSFEELKPMLQVELRRDLLEKMIEDLRTQSKIEKFDINGDPVKEDVKEESKEETAAPKESSDAAPPPESEEGKAE